MRIVVLGGGVVGVTTAYQLQRDGHEVVILERNGLTAAGTSWGNSGMVAPGHSFVWSSPKAPMILLKSLFRKDQPLSFRYSNDPRLYAWLALFLKECTATKARSNTLIKHRLATYSQDVLKRVLAEEAIDYDRDDRGILYFYRTQESLDRGVEHKKMLESVGQTIAVLDRSGVLALDPSLASGSGEIAGGVYCPTDETGDPAKFTRALAQKIVQRGGEIHTGVIITGLEVSHDTVTKVITDRGRFEGDVYVLALGSESPLLARKIGLNLPIYPVKGYSLTIPIGDSPSPPTIASIDEKHRVAISRFGDRIRVTATAEFAGYDTSHKPSDFIFLNRVVQDLYPVGAEYDQAQMWAGLRPMTPTNLPLFGRRHLSNFFLNCGHGHIGWTMSHGSARIIADLIAGRAPEIPMEGLVAGSLS